jgi:uncharacterized protein YjbJ (UPF0337 family)
MEENKEGRRNMTEKDKGAMDEVKAFAKRKAKHLAKEAAGAVADNEELAKGLAKEATGAATGDEECKDKGRLEWEKGTKGVKEDLRRIAKESLRRSKRSS